ncbi:unnamed protein product [Eruca vesicaria subsp. sativa]|uniref:Uncharacterized protein n=1 Tax=Eruca vesicaria subsp. sativa TaxID=29727 RepID=A0ABC8IT02_ERUVS|nr:unnamed protein product [Eruca vesicaria subsp. sativa]
MASSIDLKMKESVVEDWDSNFQFGFNQGTHETREHYRYLLHLFNERYEGVKAKHAEEVKVEKLNAKIEVIVQMEKVKVPPYPDWCKLDEALLYD